MKTSKASAIYPLLTLTLLSVLPSAVSAGQAGEELSDLTRGQMPAVVQEEYSKMGQQLQSELTESQTQLKTLRAERDAAAARAAEQAKGDEAGLKLLKDFDSLLHAKYVDKKGRFLPGFEIASSDSDTLNGIFLAHLSMTPLSGRTSAGQAHRQIAWGLERLEDVMKAHKDPSESNNSDFEIIGKQIRDEEARTEKLNALADILGVKLDPTIAPPPQPTRLGWSRSNPQTTTRAPASNSQSTRRTNNSD